MKCRELAVERHSFGSIMLDEALIRRLFKEAVTQSGAVGAQLSLVKGDQRMDLAEGFSHAERRAVMTTDTLMQIGSITKVFNAVMVFSLIEEGLVDLDTAVRNYLPTFRVGDAHASGKLTLRHLMSMSSGLDNGRYVYFSTADDALGKYVEHLDRLPQHFAPGDFFGYSNAGICIAGHVASFVAGKPWEDLLRERVLDPAGVTQFALLDEDLNGRSVSSGHYLSRHGGELDIIEPMFTAVRGRAPSGASFALTAADLARFGKLFITKGIADRNTRVLSASSIQQMMSPQIEVPNRLYGNAWCLGPYKTDWRGARVWGHAGGTATAMSFLHWIPEQEGVIAFMVNTHGTMGELARIVLGDIADCAFGIRRPPIDVGERSGTPMDYRRYVGTYEELGMRMHVSEVYGVGLQARFVPQRSMNERVGHEEEQSVTLRPLGNDRFVVEPADGIDKHLGVVDMAFFGDDGTGRATNALNRVFPMRRLLQPIKEDLQLSDTQLGLLTAGLR